MDLLSRLTRLGLHIDTGVADLFVIPKHARCAEHPGPCRTNNRVEMARRACTRMLARVRLCMCVCVRARMRVCNLVVQVIDLV